MEKAFVLREVPNSYVNWVLFSKMVSIFADEAPILGL